MKIRIYGKKINEWKSVDEKGREFIVQAEWTYTDYDSETGEVLGCGSEDIQYRWDSNYKNRIESRTVYAWTGKTYPSGNKQYREAKKIYFRPSDRATVNALGKLARLWFEGQDVQIRAY